MRVDGGSSDWPKVKVYNSVVSPWWLNVVMDEATHYMIIRMVKPGVANV